MLNAQFGPVINADTNKVIYEMHYIMCVIFLHDCEETESPRVRIGARIRYVPHKEPRQLNECVDGGQEPVLPT